MPMGLDFDRIKHKVEHGTGHQWTSYSDLFLVLSVTFLLLYTVANLRGGAAAVVAQEQLRVSSLRMSELEKQVRAYEVLKDDYIEKGASRDEVEMYRDLESQLALLEESAQAEYQDAAERAREAKVKFNGLNRYQALIKNIVNANLVSSAKSKRQLTMLDDRDGRIEEKDVKIDELDEETKKQEKTIEANKRRIAKIKDDLATREMSLKNLKNMSAKQRKEAEAKLRAEREEASQKIAELDGQNREATAQLQQTQVDRVIPKYLHFLELFPTLQSLANADKTKLLTARSGLGYNSRALNLQKAAQIIVHEHKKVYQAQCKKNACEQHQDKCKNLGALVFHVDMPKRFTYHQREAYKILLVVCAIVVSFIVGISNGQYMITNRIKCENKRNTLWIFIHAAIWCRNDTEFLNQLSIQINFRSSIMRYRHSQRTFRNACINIQL